MTFILNEKKKELEVEIIVWCMKVMCFTSIRFFYELLVSHYGRDSKVFASHFAEKFDSYAM
jgi:hypothetical protein